MAKQTIKNKTAFYFSDKYNLTKAKCIKDVTEYTKMQQGFNDRLITPRQVIGTGYKPQYVRGIAKSWITEQLEIAKYLLANFDTCNQLTQSQTKGGTATQ